MGATPSRDGLTDGAGSVNSFSKASSRKETTPSKAPFPHNYEAIIKYSDLEVETDISLDKLYDKLYAGVYLSRNKEKYWVERKSNKNSFMLFARSISITWSENDNYWMWKGVKDIPSSDVLVEVAELLNVCWLEIHGKFDASKLSPGTTYEVAFVIMLKDPAYGWEVPVNVRLVPPDGIEQERKECLVEKQRARWIEILAGEFTTSAQNCNGVIEFSVHECTGHWKKGLVVKGVVIRPKN